MGQKRDDKHIYILRREVIMKKLIGYTIDKKQVFEPEGIGCTSILYCKNCGKMLSRTCGRSDVYCIECAKKKNLFASYETQRHKNRQSISRRH